MKKKYFAASIAITLLFSCNKEEINLDTTTYDTISLNQIVADYDSALSSLFSKNIRIDFGDYTRDFKELSNIDNSTIDGNSIIYKSEDDSTTVIKSNDGISIIVHNNKGEENIYYVSKSTEEISKMHQRIVTSARDSHESIIKSINDNALHIKPTSDPRNEDQGVGNVQNEEINKTLLSQAERASRRYAEINIWMLRVSGYNYLDHEIYWQINDARHAVNSINSNVKLHFHVRHSDFRGSASIFTTMTNFKKYVKDHESRGHDWSSRVRKDIFAAISWGGYSDSILGLAELSSYDINHSNNVNARIVSSMTPGGSSKTFAHELLHTLGATHNSTIWYEGWWIFKFPYKDVMNTTHHWLVRRGVTKEETNINVVKRSTTFR